MTSTYANGDRLSWVSTLFEGRRVGGELRADGVETLDVRFFSADETQALRRKPHVAMFLAAGWSRRDDAQFQPPTFRPDR